MRRGHFVMIGDSLTREWLDRDPQFFEENHIVNAGICGETTDQIASRFLNDALTSRPRAVFIMAGTNDVAENQGAVADRTILDRFDGMVDAARQAGAVPIVCSIPPANGFFWNASVAPRRRIGLLNTGLRRLAERTAARYADYHALLLDGNDGLNPAFTTDGVHLNLAGYRAITPIAHAIMVEISRDDGADATIAP